MPATSLDAPVAVSATLSFGNAMSSLSDFLFSGVLVRHPRLRLAYSEGQIGWMPYILERADDVWLQHRAWGGVQDLVPEPPSTYFHRQVFGCFFRDRHGLESLHRIGVDNLVVESDNRHAHSTYPAPTGPAPPPRRVPATASEGDRRERPSVEQVRRVDGMPGSSQLIGEGADTKGQSLGVVEQQDLGHGEPPVTGYRQIVPDCSRPGKSG